MRGWPFASVLPALVREVRLHASAAAEIDPRVAAVVVAGEWPAAVEAVEEPGVRDVGLVRVLTVGEECEVLELVVLLVAVEVVDVFVGE